MAFTTPRTWTDGDVATAALFNTEIRDNITDLDSRLVAAKGTIKAWVHVTNAGTPTNDDSVNVTSLTDDGVGLTTVNFTDAIGNATYCALAQVTDQSAQAAAFTLTFASGSVQVETELSNGVSSDMNFTLVVSSD